MPDPLRLAVYRALTGGPKDRRALVELVFGSLPVSKAWTQTVDALLQHGPAKGRVAQHLGISRQALHARCRRLEQVTGLDIDDGFDRFSLYLAAQLLLVDSTAVEAPDLNRGG